MPLVLDRVAGETRNLHVRPEDENCDLSSRQLLLLLEALDSLSLTWNCYPKQWFLSTSTETAGPTSESGCRRRHSIS